MECRRFICPTRNEKNEEDQRLLHRFKDSPYEKRDIPILETKSGEVVWVCGHSIDDRFKVTDETKRVMKLEFSGSLHKPNEKG